MIALLSQSILLKAQHLVLIDSLKNQLPTVSNVQKFNLLTDIGFEYRLSYPDSTIFYCQQAFELGNELGIKSGLSKPLSFMGLAMAYKGENEKSFDYHTMAIETAKAEDDTLQLAYGYNNLGRLFFDQGDLQRAYSYFIEALTLMEETQDKLGLSYVHRSLSSFYKSQNDFEKSLESSLTALRYRKELGDLRPLLSAYSELALVYKQRNEIELAIRYFQMADSIAQSINDVISLAEINLGIAEMHLDAGNISLAFESADEAYDIIEKVGNQRLLLRGNLVMARINMFQEKYNTADLYLEETITEAERIHNQAYLRDAYLLKSQIAEKQGQQERFITLQNRYLILKEQLLNIDLTREIERMQFRYTIERNERENEILKANEERINSQLALQRIERIGLFVVIVLVSLLAFLFWRNSKRSRLDNARLARQSEFIKKQNIEIESQNRQIADQNKKLSKRNEDLAHLNNEKDTLMNIVAHDLKSPLQRIEGLSELITIEGKLSEDQLKYAAMIKSVTKSSAELISDLLDVNALESDRSKLHPVNLQVDEFIKERVRQFEAAARDKDITIKLDLNSPEPVVIDPNLLSRVVDNLVSNAIKFSFRNTEVHIVTAFEGDRLIISIKDQGPGFTEEDKAFLYQKFKKLSARPTSGESSNGLGLAIVKILTDRLKGKIDLKTELARGSEFILRFPLS